MSLHGGRGKGTLESLFLIVFRFILFLCLPLRIYVYHVHAQSVPQKSKESIKSLGAGIIDRFESPHGCWELNLGPVGSSQCSQPESCLQPPEPVLKEHAHTHEAPWFIINIHQNLRASRASGQQFIFNKFRKSTYTQLT